MRKAAIVLTLLAFFSCLFIGYTISNSANLPNFIQKNTPTLLIGVPSVPVNQQNILLVQVDQLESDSPQLVSVWGIFVYLREPSSVMFVPLHPGDEKALSDKMVREFQLTSGNGLDPKFQQMVENEIAVAFDNYILVDSAGLQQVREWIQSIEASDAYPVSDEKSLLRAVCRYVISPDRDQKASLEWKGMFPDHVSTNLAFQDAMSSWETVAAQGSSVRCEVFNTR